MRYDTPIYFQRITQGVYDPETGDYGDEIAEETCVYADVTSAGANTLNLVYGEIKEGSLVVRLRQHYTDTFNRIRIGDKQYRVDLERKLRTGHVFTVSEVK